MIIIGTDKPSQLVSDYRKRWGIETLFGCLKKRGFDLESTHMTQADRMNKLFGLLAVAFTWCITAGQWKYGKAKMLPLSQHYRPEKSLFRLGLDLLRMVLKNPQLKDRNMLFTGLIDLLSGT